MLLKDYKENGRSSLQQTDYMIGFMNLRLIYWFLHLRPPHQGLHLEIPILNHKSSSVQSPQHAPRLPLKRKLSSFALHNPKVGNPTRRRGTVLLASMDAFVNALPSAATPTVSSPRKRGRPKKAVTTEQQNI
jgi:hypothetical protein